MPGANTANLLGNAENHQSRQHALRRTYLSSVQFVTQRIQNIANEPADKVTKTSATTATTTVSQLTPSTVRTQQALNHAPNPKPTNEP